MLVRVVLLTFLASVVCHFRTRDAEKLPFLGGAPVVTLLEATAEHCCSATFTTHNSYAQSSIIFKEAWEPQQLRSDKAMFRVQAHHRNINITQCLSQLVSLARWMCRLSSCTMVMVGSHEVAFLTASAEWYLKDYLLVRTTRNNNQVLRHGPQVEQETSRTPTHVPVVAEGNVLSHDKISYFHDARVNMTSLTFAPSWEEQDLVNIRKFSGTDYYTSTSALAAFYFAGSVVLTSSWAKANAILYTKVTRVMMLREKYDFHLHMSMDFSLAPLGLQALWIAAYNSLPEIAWIPTYLSRIFMQVAFFKLCWLSQMEARVTVLLMCCSMVAANLAKQRDLSTVVGVGTAAALVSSLTNSSCSIIFISDDSNLSLVLYKELTESWRHLQGMTILKMSLAGEIHNVTQRLPEWVPQARKVRQVTWCSMALVVSQEPEFLTAFAEWSLKGRLLVWSTRLVVVTRLLLPQLQALLPTYWTFSMMNTVFLNVEKESSIITCVWYTYLPYSPSGGKINKVKAWTLEEGFYKYHNLLPSSEKFVNFHGAMVNVTPMPFMPHWRTVTPEGSSIPIHEGSDYELLMAVAATLNFSIRTVPCNTWAEATRLVEERISLMCPIYHNKLTVRAEKYDFSFTYEFSFLSFAMAKPTQKPRWQSLYYPLSLEVWLIVLATVFFVPVVYISVNFVQQAIHGKKLWSAGRVFQDMAGLILGQSLPYEVSWFTSNRILLAAWLVFVIVFGSVYKGNLTAHLTLPKYPSRPETLKELVETVDKVTMPDYGESFLKYFRRSNSPLFIALGNLMELGPNAVEGLQRALRAKEAHVSGRRYLKYQVADKFGNEDGTNRLYVGRETVFPGHSGWPIPHDAPYTEQLDNSIMAVLEAGLYEKWTSDILAKTIMERKRRLRQPQQGDQQKDSAPKKSSQSLTITHTQGAFILLLLGLILSAITFAAEMKFP